MAFNRFFELASSKHNYNTRSAKKCSYYIGPVRTNYGKFNLRYRGAILWNALIEDLKNENFLAFKYKIKRKLMEFYI